MFKIQPTALPLLVLVLTVPARADETPIPTVDPFVVNTTTAGNQTAPSIASSGNGQFVVVWQSDDSTALRAQRILVDGSPVGSEIVCNDATDYGAVGSRVGMNASGGFVVSWSDVEIAGQGSDVKARRYDSNGNALGAEFVVNSYTTGSQTFSDIDVQPSGAFVVAWSSTGGDGDILAQRFDPTGQPVGSVIQVAPATDDRMDPQIAVDDGGSFIVAWKLRDLDLPMPNQIQARRFASDGQPQGGVLEVSDLSTFTNSEVALDSNGSGQFVVAWAAYVDPVSDHDIFARRYDSSGAAQGAAFQVNAATSSYQIQPDVSVNEDGSFQVAWFADGPSPSFRDIDGQSFHADGSRSGGLWTASTRERADSNASPAMTAVEGDQFVVVWADEDSLGEIYGRTFLVVGVFSDGFESADVSAWSTSSP